jgi:hypothetical protein
MQLLETWFSKQESRDLTRAVTSVRNTSLGKEPRGGRFEVLTPANRGWNYNQRGRNLDFIP